MAAESAAGRAADGFVRLLRWLGRLARGELVKRVGGPARARVITLFAAVLALNGADAATVGAIAPQLEHALHIGNTKIGLLSSISLLVGAVFTIPVGMLVDRIRRIPVLAVSIILWSLASAVSAFSGSYSTLLLTRLVLGAVTASAGPAIASLTGDYFPSAERGRVWAYILAGETVGTAIGFIVSGSVASLIDWRAAFILLAIPGFFLARTLWRTVPEPLRGGQSRLAVGVVSLEEVLSAAEERSEREAGAAGAEWAADAEREPAADGAEGEPAPADAEAAYEAVRARGIEPDPELILDEDPARMPLMRAVRYVLRIPSNVLLIIGSSLGYFYFAGLQTFATLFVRGHYHASQATAELVLALLVVGALIGTLLSGRITDLMVRNGMLEARVWVPAICFIAAAILLVPGLLATHVFPATWFDMAGAGFLAAANPPLDAARLDIVPPGLWGRAESVRTVARSLVQAVAPLLFGGLSQLVAGIVPAQTPVGTHPGIVSPSTARGLEITFLILLGTLVAAGVFLARARHRYAVDVATAAASAGAAGGPGR
jgi:MFS family permease